jgi:hypothetical protein
MPGENLLRYRHEGVSYEVVYDYYPADETASETLCVRRIQDPAGNEVSRQLPADVQFRMAGAALRQARTPVSKPPGWEPFDPERPFRFLRRTRAARQLH